jgi:tyrosinase
LNPTSYAIDKPSGEGTFSIQSGTQETSKTPLAPFNDATGKTFWDSDGARYTTTFNYAYPETQQWKFPTQQQYQNSVLAAVQKLYGATSNQFMSLMGVNTTALATAPQANLQGSVAGQEPLQQAAQPAELSRGGEDFEAQIGKGKIASHSGYQVTDTCTS